MATRNPFGTVALGQEGSGLAQVLTPYDSAKYDNAIIEQEQTNRKDEAKALQEEAKTLKEPDKINPTKYWNRDFALYDKEFNELYDAETALFTEFAVLSNDKPKLGEDATEWRERKFNYDLKKVELQEKLNNWEQKMTIAIQNKEDFEFADAYVANHSTEVDPVKQDKIFKTFFEPPQELVDKFGSVEKARAYYTHDMMGGRDGLIAHQFDWLKHNDRIKQETATTAKKTAGGSVVFNEEKGGWVDTQTNNIIYDLKQMRGITLSAIASDKNALIYFRDEEPKLREALDIYAKNKGTKREYLSTDDVWNFLASDDPVAKDYLQLYYWNNSSETSVGFQQARDGYGSGNDLQTSINDGSKVMRNEGSVDYQASKLLGAKYIKPQMFAQVVVTTNLGGKYINKHSSTWTPSTNTKTALKGEPPPQTPVTLKSATIEANTITIAKDDITYNDGTGTITINKGSSVDVNLLKNKNFVAANHGKLDYKIYGTAIFTDNAYKLDHPLYAPIEDMKTLFTPDGYSEVQKRNKIEYKQDGSVIYFSEDNEEQGSGTFDATNY